MVIEPIYASAYFKFGEGYREKLIRNGLVPVNDKLFDFIDDDNPIQLVRGGRGGGKSNTACIKVVKAAVEEDYVKCYFGRKVFDRVRGSVYADLCKTIEMMGLEDEFEYSKKPNSSMNIIHKKSGNSFLPFGGDNPDSMKSISDPTHILIDEFDQFTEWDFGEIAPTLRTTRGKNILIGCFNTYSVSLDHWIIKVFYPHLYTGEEVRDVEMTDAELKGISDYFINFTDNYFIDQEEYRLSLLRTSGGDMKLFEGRANGEWGYDKKGGEWYGAFRKGIHVKKIERQPFKPDHLSIDFNLRPYMSLMCAQIEGTDTELNFNIYKEFCYPEPKNTTESVCKGYEESFEGSISDVFYYGDAQGTRGVEGFGSRVTRFDDLKNTLARYITSSSDRTTRRNPGVTKRRDLINKILSGQMYIGNKKVNIFIDESCKNLIKDLSQLKIGVDGKHKEKVKDPVTGVYYEKLGHMSDCLDYFVAYILKDYL